MATKTKKNSMSQQLQQHIAEHHSQPDFHWGNNTLSDVLTHGDPRQNSGNQMRLLQAIASLPLGGILGGIAGGVGGEVEGANAAEEGGSLAGRAGRAAKATKQAGEKLQGGKVGNAIAAHPVRSAAVPLALAGAGLSAAGAINSKKKSAPKGQAATTPAASTPAEPGVGIMPLFMQSVLGPYMKSIMDQINQTATGYGNTMQGMLNGPNAVALNPMIKQALGAMIPGQQASMQLLGQSALGSGVGNAGLDQLSQQIQQAQAAQQAAAGMYEKYMVPMEYGGGTGIPGLGTTGTGTAPQNSTNPLMNPLSAGSMYQQINNQRVATAGG